MSMEISENIINDSLAGATDKTAELAPQESKVVEGRSISRARRRKIIRQVRSGRAYIQATYNNTIVTLTDLQGNVLAWSSAGRTGFRGPKKSTPYAAGVIVKEVVEKVKPYGLSEVSVFVRGVGSVIIVEFRILNYELSNGQSQNTELRT
ncbi:MAG: 30S ribosomal protein S11 [Parcubacteria group bacterium GW2011_GWA2_46_9]|nr:MAG: 30S ribosomal protein S11 [Parcubacteria group bacterium GW2011_GWA2_46_9]